MGFFLAFTEIKSDQDQPNSVHPAAVAVHDPARRRTETELAVLSPSPWG
jgi:hypothetical protein